MTEEWAEIMEFVRGRLDWGYVREVADAVAFSMQIGVTAETAFQPGDGTRYNLLFVPMSATVSMPPRVKDGVEWSRSAFPGVQGDRDAWVFVAWDEHDAGVLELPTVPEGLAPWYVKSRWGASTTDGSAAALTLLFREVATSYWARKLVEAKL